MPYTDLSDSQSVAATLPIAAATAGTYKIGYYNMAGANRAQFIVQVGAIGGSSTIDAVVKQATDTNGTGAKALTTTKTITQIVASNKCAVVNVAATDLDVNNAFTCVELLITVGTATAQLGGVLLVDPEITPPTSVADQVVL